MGGLPKWEYILHLFVNGFHFASIAVFLVIKIKLVNNEFTLVQNFNGIENHLIFIFIVKNLIPGAIIIAIIHIITLFASTKIFWNKIRTKVTCC